MLIGCRRCSTASRDPLSIGLWAFGYGLWATGYSNSTDLNARHGLFAVQPNGFYSFDHIHTRDDTAKDSVLAVKRRRPRQHDEERAAGAGRGVEPGHRHDAAIVRRRIEFGLKIPHEGLLLLVERPASRGHVPALNHEALDNAVERGPVVHAR